MVRLKASVMVLSAVLLSAALAGCNTVSGFGKDIQAGGKGLSHAANKVHGKDKKSAAKAK